MGSDYSINLVECTMKRIIGKVSNELIDGEELVFISNYYLTEKFFYLETKKAFDH